MTPIRRRAVLSACLAVLGACLVVLAGCSGSHSGAPRSGTDPSQLNDQAVGGSGVQGVGLTPP
ncbi:MAG: hypothetical protein DLM57_08165, partial [Pseudonocardiales bacterium]